MTEKMDFAGGTAVITGAGAGIGAGLAREAGRLGMTVVVADIAADRAAEVADAIVAAGGKAHPATLDVRDDSAVAALAADVRARHGPVRLLINNAGIETFGFSWELTAEQWRRSTEINVLGVVNGLRAFMPGMIEDTRGGGRAAIANLSSVGAFMSTALQAPYVMSKHATLVITECLMQEVELLGLPIDVSAIIPSSVRTRIMDDAQVAGEAKGTLAEAYRRTLAETMGPAMAPDKAGRVVFEQLREGWFWVSTHPEDTEGVARRRAELYLSLDRPKLTSTILPRLLEARAGPGKPG